MQAVETVQPVAFLSLLADAARWRILAALARSDRRVQDLAEIVGKPVNQISYHLGRLRKLRLVRERRSDADARDVYYGLDLERLVHLYRSAGDSLHPALSVGGEASPASERAGAVPRPRVLFLCTENSARSQMAEGILRHRGRGQVEVASAGSLPSRVHPLAVQVLSDLGIDIGYHSPKSLDQFLGQTFDYVITVCDRIKETCPTFPGDPERIHWSFADPAAVEGSYETRYWAFRVTAKELMTMVGYLLIMVERDRKLGDWRIDEGNR